MKVGEINKINDYCGIACIEVNGKKWVTVYANVSEDGECGLGNVIAKGETKEEALMDAVEFFVSREKRYEDQYEQFENLYKSLENHVLTNDRKMVLPITFEEEDGYSETCNAHICEYEGIAIPGMC